MCLLDPVGVSGHSLTTGPWWGAVMWTSRRLFSPEFLIVFFSIFQGKMAFSHLPALLFLMPFW